MPLPKVDKLKDKAKKVKADVSKVVKSAVSDAKDLRAKIQDKRLEKGKPYVSQSIASKSLVKEDRLKKKIAQNYSLADRQANKREFFRAEKKRNINNEYLREKNSDSYETVGANRAKKTINQSLEKLANKRSQNALSRAKKNERKLDAQKNRTREIGSIMEKSGMKNKNKEMVRVGSSLKKGKGYPLYYTK